MGSRETEKFCAWDEQLALAEALVLLSLARLAVQRWGLRRCYTVGIWLARRSRPAHWDGEAAGRIVRSLAGVVVRANRRYSLRPKTCLPESVALWWMLRRRGLLADLRLGVRTTLGRFEAHAWVEYQGQVLNEAPDIARVYAPYDLTSALESEVL